jgi:type II secretory pathway component HofQ
VIARRLALAAALLAAAAGPAMAEYDPCARGTRWRGTTVDIDLKDAGLHDVFRMLSDVGRINVVVADEVRGTVTLRLKQVPWDQALCVVAASKQLKVTADGSVYLIRPRPR